MTSRIPTRTNADDRYFSDTFQAMPLDGYTKMFERMLDHPLIEKYARRRFRGFKDRAHEIADHIIFTGPVDEYFDFRFGKLPYRSLKFDHQTLDQEWFQPVAVVNYPSEEVPFTRISEYKYLTGQESPVTTITYEYPSAEGDPYYPIPRPENQELFKKYEALADETEGVTFVGRLATYRYYNMDQIVGQALATFRRMDEKREKGSRRRSPPNRPPDFVLRRRGTLSASHGRRSIRRSCRTGRRRAAMQIRSSTADFPDPAVIHAPDGFYYAYATQTQREGGWINIQVARSRDLIHWEHLGDALPEKPIWARGRRISGRHAWSSTAERYLMYYSATPDVCDVPERGHCLAVATATRPPGPSSTWACRCCSAWASNISTRWSSTIR